MINFSQPCRCEWTSCLPVSSKLALSEITHGSPDQQILCSQFCSQPLEDNPARKPCISFLCMSPVIITQAMQQFCFRAANPLATQMIVFRQQNSPCMEGQEVMHMNIFLRGIYFSTFFHLIILFHGVVSQRLSHLFFTLEFFDFEFLVWFLFSIFQVAIL